MRDLYEKAALAPLADRTGVVYVLHFDRPVVVRPDYTAGHYVGWTLRLNRRLHAHRCGIATASMVTKRARKQGVSFTVTGVCSGTTEDERRTNGGPGITGSAAPAAPAAPAVTV